SEASSTISARIKRFLLVANFSVPAGQNVGNSTVAYIDDTGRVVRRFNLGNDTSARLDVDEGERYDVRINTDMFGSFMSSRVRDLAIGGSTSYRPQ
ncbi:MAG: hypothetical protein SVS85_03305, partial [Candidatus Nanohaloarchaea archaeon]|nr:hypothetical protein [Candidatus Nanohaloarchaea archaeon]